MRHRPELDGIRAVAVGLAVGEHTGIPWLSGGWIGVDIFFVLSGFLITTILLEEWIMTERIRLGRFYAKRILRLYPALVAMFILCAFWWKIFGNQGTVRGYETTVMLGLTYTQDFALGIFGLPYGALGQTWSLAVEEQFYLFWAPTLAFLLWRRWNPIPWIIGLISVSWISLWVTSKPYPAATSPLTYYRPDTRAGELFLGCLLAFVVRRWGRRIERYRSLQLVMAPIGLAALFGLLWFVNRQGRQWIFPQEEIAVGCAAAVFVLGVVIADHRKPLNFILALSPIAWLGRISYGIYIYFVAVFILVDHYQLTEGMGLYRATAVKLSILVLVAALSHYLVERPFLRIKDRISSRTMASRHAATHSEPDSLAPALKDPDVADAPVGASTARHARREEHRP